MSDIYKIDVDTSTGAQLPAQARAALDGIVNDICRDADLSYDGTAAHIRQTDSQSDYLYANIETLIYRLIGTGWRTTFSAVRIIDNSERYEMNITAEYRGEWKD